MWFTMTVKSTAHRVGKYRFVKNSKDVSFLYFFFKTVQYNAAVLMNVPKQFIHFYIPSLFPL